MSFEAGRRAFLRLVGLTYAIAGLSFLVQVDGLIGPNGLSPLSEFLIAARTQFGTQASRLFPTLCWLDASMGFVHSLCWVCILGGLGIAAGLLQMPLLAACWVSYLSLQVAGQQFMGFQWDILLLETGLVAFLWAPVSVLPRPLAETRGSRLGRWLAYSLLFRLMFASGFVKLASGDALWRNLTALTVHYETQPLPTWLGWWANQFPVPIQRFSCLMMFCIELGTPFLILVPVASVRLAAAGLITGLMALIALTGNYGFFNLLAVALCLPLVEDRYWPGWLRPGGGRPARNWPLPAVAVPAGLIGLCGIVLFTGQLGFGSGWPGPLVSLQRTVSNYRAVDGYGLFAVMTPERNEIVVEGSADGKHWLPYAFRWKPSDPSVRPSFVAPHMPRLDWQMWFAALGSVRENPWFVMLCWRLLHNEPDVVRLLAVNPFPGPPPVLVRTRLERWRFSHLGDRFFWTVSPAGSYLPAVSLKSFARRA